MGRGAQGRCKQFTKHPASPSSKGRGPGVKGTRGAPSPRSPATSRRARVPTKVFSPTDAAARDADEQQRRRKAREGEGKGGSPPTKPRGRSAKSQYYAREYAKVRRSICAQLSVIRREQLFLDTYDNEGWKGSSKDKLRPTRELDRAKAAVLRAKVSIRESLRELEEANGDKSYMPAAEAEAKEEDSDNDGIGEEEIFCAKCGEYESWDDNDILLCDGNCNRAYHQKCLDPELPTEDIPEGDEGWLCPACDTKADCINMIAEDFETKLWQESTWERALLELLQDVFREDLEAANTQVSTAPADDELFPSEDEEDDDYDPTAPEPESTTPSTGANLDEEEEGSGSDDDDGASDSELSEGLADFSDEDSEVELTNPGKGATRATRSMGPAVSPEEAAASVASEECEEENPATLIVAGKRRRPQVDYQKLHQELFGEAGEGLEDKEDEGFTPVAKRGRKKAKEDCAGSSKKTTPKRRPKSAKPSVPMSPKETVRAKNCSSLSTPRSTSPKVNTKTTPNRKSPASLKNGKCQLSPGGTRRGLPEEAIQLLEAQFKKSAWPEVACKEDIARKGNITPYQVQVWFQNKRQRLGIKKSK